MGAAEALGCLSQNVLGSALRIAEHVGIPQPHDTPSLAFEPDGARLVVVGLLGMLPTVDFDRQFRFAASEIDNVRANNQLARKAWAITRKEAPQCPLSVGCTVAKRARPIGHDLRDPTAHATG